MVVIAVARKNPLLNSVVNSVKLTGVREWMAQINLLLMPTSMPSVAVSCPVGFVYLAHPDQEENHLCFCFYFKEATIPSTSQMTNEEEQKQEK